MVFVFLSVWLTSLSIMIWLHPCCCRWYYFILFHGWVAFHCIHMHHVVFICSAVDGHLGCFRVLAIVLLWMWGCVSLIHCCLILIRTLWDRCWDFCYTHEKTDSDKLQNASPNVHGTKTPAVAGAHRKANSQPHLRLCESHVKDEAQQPVLTKSPGDSFAWILRITGL